MKLIRLIALSLCLALLCGCSILPFSTPEEQRAAKAADEAARLALQTQADPAAALQSDLKYRKALANSAGTLLAEYTADFPYFSKTGQKSRSFERINDYYLNELAGLDQDAQVLFARARAAYGDEWDTVTEATVPFSVTIGYELLEAPAGYASIRCDYRLRQGDQTMDYVQAQVFLLDNGWRLTLENLFGQDYAQAEPLLLADILRWCEDKGIEVTDRDSRTLSEFSEYYALTREEILFYIKPFTLSNKNAVQYTVPVSIAPYRGMLDINTIQ